jgi:hypothetical protein
MILETNAATLELHTCNSRHRNSQSFVSKIPGQSYCTPLPPLILKVAAPQQELVCFASGEDTVSNRWKGTFRTRFYTEPPGRQSIYAQCKTVEQKGSICKDKMVCLLCLMQLWTVFGLASRASHKNECAAVVSYEIVFDMHAVSVFVKCRAHYFVIGQPFSNIVAPSGTCA